MQRQIRFHLAVVDVRRIWLSAGGTNEERSRWEIQDLHIEGRSAPLRRGRDPGQEGKDTDEDWAGM